MFYDSVSALGAGLRLFKQFRQYPQSWHHLNRTCSTIAHVQRAMELKWNCSIPPTTPIQFHILLPKKRAVTKFRSHSWNY